MIIFTLKIKCNIFLKFVVPIAKRVINYGLANLKPHVSGFLKLSTIRLLLN